MNTINTIKILLVTAILSICMSASVIYYVADANKKYEEQLAQQKIENEHRLVEMQKEQLIDSIVRKHYNVSREFVSKVVDLAIKYEQPSFPNRYDILSIIGIESNYNPNAKSKLKKDAAIGLTQIRPRIWKLDPMELSSNIDMQVFHAVKILSQYYNELGDKELTIMAYNMGIGSIMDGRDNPRYLNKFNNEFRVLTSCI